MGADRAVESGMTQPSSDAQARYDDDVFAWSLEQADVLRAMRGRAGLPNGLDLENVIEEIAGVGNSQLSGVESYVRLILVHAIKCVSSASSEPKRHWRAEIANFHADLLPRYSPSMRRALDLDLIWRRAVGQAQAQLEERDESVAPGLSGRCPVDFADLVGETIAVDVLLARISDPGTTPP